MTNPEHEKRLAALAEALREPVYRVVAILRMDGTPLFDRTSNMDDEALVEFAYQHIDDIRQGRR